MYTYHYIAEIPGISLGAPIAFVDISRMLQNIMMEQSRHNEVLIRVIKSRTFPEVVALNEATLELDNLLDRLSLLDNHGIFAVTYKGYQDDEGVFHESRENTGTSGKLVANIADPLAYYNSRRHKRRFVDKINPGLTRLHRTAQGMPNGIGKYLLLYGALQLIYGETQAKVDDQLLKMRPSTLMVKGKHREETILSHIRNMIAHPEHGIDIQTLNRQAEIYCPMLSEIVRDELIR